MFLLIVFLLVLAFMIQDMYENKLNHLKEMKKLEMENKKRM